MSSKPSLLASLVGTPLVAWPTIGLIGWIGWQAMTGGTAPVVGILCVPVGAYVAKCADEVERHRQWKSQWNAMGEDGPRRGLSFTALRWIVGLGAWAFGAYWAAQPQPDETMATAALLFWIGTACLVLLTILRKLRRAPQRGREAAPRPVRLERRGRASSPAVSQIEASLPDYAKALLRRSSEGDRS